ncbi:MAG: GNAT family N-acetyltransferase, partial [Actinobacteria bacterium]|nr:GNAT family N-acetyltransferase [Actinomycetota bacterium]
MFDSSSRKLRHGGPSIARMSPSIRPATPSDTPAIAAIYAPFVTDSAVSFEFEPPGADVFATRIERGQLHYPWLVAEDDGEVVGYGNASG